MNFLFSPIFLILTVLSFESFALPQSSSCKTAYQQAQSKYAYTFDYGLNDRDVVPLCPAFICFPVNGITERHQRTFLEQNRMALSLISEAYAGKGLILNKFASDIHASKDQAAQWLIRADQRTLLCPDEMDPMGYREIIEQYEQTPAIADSEIESIFPHVQNCTDLSSKPVGTVCITKEKAYFQREAKGIRDLGRDGRHPGVLWHLDRGIGQELTYNQAVDYCSSVGLSLPTGYSTADLGRSRHNGESFPDKFSDLTTAMSHGIFEALPEITSLHLWGTWFKEGHNVYAYTFQGDGSVMSPYFWSVNYGGSAICVGP